MDKKSLGQSSAILESDFIAIVAVRNRQIVWANAAMHRIFGYAPAELIGQPTRILFTNQESYEEFGRSAYATTAVGKIYSGTALQKRKDGSTGWYEFNISRLSGDPDTVVGAIVDRTSSHKLVENLKTSEQRFRSVVEDQTEAISRFLPDGTFVFVNEVFCRLFGKSADELIGKVWHPVAHPDDIAMIEDKLGKMSLDNPVITIENRVYAASGEVRWLQFVNRGLFDATGTLAEIQSVGRDITPLKQTEAALKETEERLEMALSGSNLAIWDWNLATGEIAFGHRWYEMLGYPADSTSWSVDQWRTIFEPNDLERVEAALSEHLAGNSPCLETEHRLRHFDNHWVTVRASGKVTQRADDGTPLRMVGTVQDITNQKRLNDEGLALLKRIEGLIRDINPNPSTRKTDSEAVESLTKRELQVLGMIADGMTSAQIGKQLRLATNTVISHRQNLMSKLDLHSTAEVTRFAVEHGLVKTA